MAGCGMPDSLGDWSGPFLLGEAGELPICTIGPFAAVVIIFSGLTVLLAPERRRFGEPNVLRVTPGVCWLAGDVDRLAHSLSVIPVRTSGGEIDMVVVDEVDCGLTGLSLASLVCEQNMY